MRYIKSKAVKNWAKEHKVQASKQFLQALDVLIEDFLQYAIRQAKKRLTPEHLPKR